VALSALVRPLLSVLSPAGPGAALTILIFHRVLPAPDPLFPDEVDVARFDTICRCLKQWFQVLPLAKAVQALAAGRLPARAAAITFDDGYADNHDAAMPVLQRHGLSATFFIATGFLDGGVMWNDQVIEALRRSARADIDLGDIGLPAARLALGSVAERRSAVDAVLTAAKYLALDDRAKVMQRLLAVCGVASPQGLMMSSRQVQAMHSRGMGIGAHTVNHPILARLSAGAAQEEMGRSKAQLESLLQTRVGLFAYPNGRPERDYVAPNVAAVQALGFDAAVSTAPGVAVAGSDLFQIPRFTPWDRAPWRFGLRLARNLRTPVTRVARLV